MNTLAQRSQRTPSWRGGGRWAGTFVLLLLAVIAYRFAFGAYFMLDDFGLLTIVRQFGNPLEPFYREHIPGGLYYRPLGMLVWWLSQHAFGAIAAWHYLLNLGLLVAAASLLWTLVERGSGSRPAGFAVALVFVVHPIAIGCSLWLSDRFDQLALVLGLLGLLATLDYSRTAETRRLAVAGLWFALALLAKEIALAPLAGAMVLCLGAGTVMDRRRRWAAVFAAFALTAAWLTVRTTVLSTTRTGQLLELKSLPQLVQDGLLMWAAGWVDYAGYWVRLPMWQMASIMAGLLIVAVLLIVAIRRRIDPVRRSLILAGLVMLAATAMLQWPVIGLQNLRIGAYSTPIELVVNARYFYMALAATLIVVANLLAGLEIGHSTVAVWIRPALLLLLVPWLLASQRLAHSYRNETHSQRGLVAAATKAIEHGIVPTGTCQIYLLDTHSWMFGWVSDEAVKAVIADLPRIEHCLIQTEHTPWYHVVVLDWRDASAVLPLTPMPGDVYALDPPRIGRARILALNASPLIDPTAMPHAIFLAYQDGVFVDVSADVVGGKRKPAFFCNRRLVQCPP